VLFIWWKHVSDFLKHNFETYRFLKQIDGSSYVELVVPNYEFRQKQKQTKFPTGSGSCFNLKHGYVFEYQWCHAESYRTV
jgi:hypothetical protein